MPSDPNEDPEYTLAVLAIRRERSQGLISQSKMLKRLAAEAIASSKRAVARAESHLRQRIRGEVKEGRTQLNAAEKPRRTLLVVEDDNHLRGMYRTALCLAGYEVNEAADGLEALRSLDRALPHLIVLDLGLPLLSGHAVAREVAAQAHLRDIPIVVVTGSSEQLDYVNVACVLRKPINSDDLTQAVRRCLGSSAAQADLDRR